MLNNYKSALLPSISLCWNISFWMKYLHYTTWISTGRHFCCCFSCCFGRWFERVIGWRVSEDVCQKNVVIYNWWKKYRWNSYKLILCLINFVFLTFFASNILIEAIATIINPFAFSVFSWGFTITWAVVYTKCFTFIFPEIVCSIYEHGCFSSAAICTINQRLSRSYTYFRSSALFFIGYFCPIWRRKWRFEKLRRSIFHSNRLKRLPIQLYTLWCNMKLI